MTENPKPVPAPYIPFRTLETATAKLEEQGLPQQLDGSAFPTLSGGVRNQVLRSFEFMGFTDADGFVQPMLEHWVHDVGERPAIMRGIVTSKYAGVVDLANRNGTPAQMRIEIEKLGVSGSTGQKAIRFYIAASEFAGLPVPPTWKQKKARGMARGSSRRPRRSADRETTDTAETQQESASPAGNAEVVTLEGGAGTVTLTPDINLMELTNADRDWLFQLIDHFHSYESPEAESSGTSVRVDGGEEDHGA